MCCLYFIDFAVLIKYLVAYCSLHNLCLNLIFLDFVGVDCGC